MFSRWNKGTSPIKADGDIFNNKKRKSSALASAAIGAGPKAPPTSQYNNEEAFSSTTVPILKSSDIIATTATTGMPDRKTDITSFFGKKQTSTSASFDSVAGEPPQPWSIFMENSIIIVADETQQANNCLRKDEN